MIRVMVYLFRLGLPRCRNLRLLKHLIPALALNPAVQVLPSKAWAAVSSEILTTSHLNPAVLKA
jgi:hypothetical protein